MGALDKTGEANMTEGKSPEALFDEGLVIIEDAIADYRKGEVSEFQLMVFIAPMIPRLARLSNAVYEKATFD